MSSASEIIRIFAHVPLPWEVVKVRGKVRPDTLVPDHVGKIADPVEWLTRSLIPLKYCELPSSVNGLFQPSTKLENCYVTISNRDGEVDLTKARVRHTLWHEIGHAIDYIGEANEAMHVTPEGFYSKKHHDVLVQHCALIVSMRVRGNIHELAFSQEDWLAYASTPVELWAELVAQVVANPAALETATALWSAVKPDLEARHIL